MCFRRPNMMAVPRAVSLSVTGESAFTEETLAGCDLEECCKKPWSHISYWECNRHIGHTWLPVQTSALVVLNEEPQQKLHQNEDANRPVWSKQGRLCLDRLVRRSASPSISPPPPASNREHFHSSPSKQRRRLSHEGISLLLLPKGQILLTNQTPATPIFVASPCFVGPGEKVASDWPVCRVAPSHSLVVFDTRIYEDRIMEAGGSPWPGKSIFGPVLHISLGKGWGPTYQRTDFTHCPARLEIWLNLAGIKAHGSTYEAWVEQKNA